MLNRWIPPWAVAMLVIFATGTVWLRLSIIRTTYSISQTDQSIRKAQQEKEQLQLKVAALRSPRRLEGLARTKFGFAQPRMDQIIYIDSKKMESGDRIP